MMKDIERIGIFEDEGELIEFGDVVSALKEVGIENGDIIFVHSDVSVFGKLCLLEREKFMGLLVGAIKESVGDDGTVIMPAFSYSFCEGEVYDPENSKSTVGALTDFFWRLPDVRRTIHPIFSVAVFGKGGDYFADVGKDSFDEASIFAKLREKNAKILFFGAPFQSCTFIHHIEQMHKVPYRFMKTFKGKVKLSGKEYDEEATYLVRKLDGSVITDLSRFEDYLIGNESMKRVGLGKGKLLMIESNRLFEEGFKVLDKDVRFFLKNN